MYSNKNNMRSELVADVSTSATSIAITSWEWVLRETDTVACLEHYENNVCTKREIVKITAINSDTMTITRWFAECVMNDNTKTQWQTKQSFVVWDFLSVYLTKELRESITSWITTNQTNLATMVARITAPRNCINDCCQSRKDAIDCAYTDKYCWNAWFWTWADWDCVIDTDTFLDASCEYNFNNLTICPDVLVRFEWEWVPTINVRNNFKNCWIIDLRAWYVPNCCQTDCRLIQWCEICNQRSDWCACCGWTGWAGWTYSSHCWCAWKTWCSWDCSTWWYGWDWWNWNTWWTWCPWCAPDWCNGWDWWRGWSNPNSYSWWGWGWGGWWAWRFWNWWNGWEWWIWDEWAHQHGVGWNGWNSWLRWIWWKGWLWWSTWNNWAWNGWNWYIWGEGWDWWECWRAWNGWCWIVVWWKGWDWLCNKRAWDWWNAITNVYWFHLNARNIRNNCVNAHGWDWWKGWKADCWQSWNGWNGANWWQMIVSYANMREQWCFDVSAWLWGEPWFVIHQSCWWTSWCSWCAWQDWRVVFKSSKSQIISNFDLQLDTQNQAVLISWKDPNWNTWKNTMVRVSTTDYPATENDWILVVNETTKNQYSLTWYSMSATSWTTYYFTAFAFDTDDNLLDTETWTITAEFWRTPTINTIWYYTMNNDILNHATSWSTFPDWEINNAVFSTAKVHWDNTYSLYCDWTTYAYLPASSEFAFWTSDFTISCRVYSQTNFWNMTWFISNYQWNWPYQAMQWYRISDRFSWQTQLNFCRNAWDKWTNNDIWVDWPTNISIYNDWRHHVVLTRNSWVIQLYLDKVSVYTNSSYTWKKVWNDEWRIYFGMNYWDWSNNKSVVYLNDVIFENRWRSQQDIADYYDLTS